ncbi:MAG: lysostaphin resistance A-like protein [Planctomycetota bacterium]
MTSPPEDRPPEPPPPEPPPSPAPPEPRPGALAAILLLLPIAAISFGFDRALALVASPRAVRDFQLGVLYAGKIVREKPLLAHPLGRFYSYAFLGQEAISCAGHVLVAVAAYLCVRRSLERPFALDRKAAWLALKTAALLGAAFAVLGVVAGLVAARVEGGLHLRVFLDRLDMPLLADPVGRLLALTGFLFAAPLAEELVFRGVVYRALRGRLRAPAATIVQAGLFAACHLDTGLDAPLIAIPYFWGIAAAVLYERTRSLGAAVLLHALGNAGGLVVVALIMGYGAEIYSLLGGV